MIVAEVVMLLGAFLIFVSGVGVIRFRDVLARMHALSKASTLGLLLVMTGATIGLDRAADISIVLLAAMLQVLTSPVSANLMSRATYRAADIPHTVDADDELADR